MKIIFATNNEHKLKEVRALLPDFEIISLKDIGCFEDIAETGKTLIENAKIKADFISKNFGLDCFADDTGLEIESLGGAPGVYSARYAGEGCNADDNMKKVLIELENMDNRNATFRTVIALIINGDEYIFQGECNGEITKTKNGVGGFGYDPIFMPQGYEITFAEMSKQEKGALSHRGRAVDKLVSFLPR